MRLLERTMKWVEIAPKLDKVDGLGGVAEDFGAHRRVRASVIPSSGGLVDHASGKMQAQTMCLLMPEDASIAPGDGVCVDANQPNWRCVCVENWSSHVAASLERIVC